MNKKRKHSTTTQPVDVDQVAKNIESIIDEPITGIMNSHGVTLLLMWHELWQAFNHSELDALEAIQLNAELIQVGRLMEAFHMISPQGSIQLNYVIYSLTEHHLRDQKRNYDGDYVIELHLNNNDKEKAHYGKDASNLQS